jgi:hypothetical protein
MLSLSGALFQPDRGNLDVRLLGGGEEPGTELLYGNSVTAPPCYPVGRVARVC